MAAHRVRCKKIGTVFVIRESKKSRGQIKIQIENILNSTINTIQIAGFPSGTTTLHEEKIWKKGLFEIAQNTKTEIQPFRISYSHPRNCAYIDDDHLFSSLMGLFLIKNKIINFDWGQAFQPENIDIEIENTRIWTGPVTV